MRYPLYTFITYFLLSIVCLKAQNNDTLRANDSAYVEDEVEQVSDPVKREILDLKGKKVYLFEIHDEIGPSGTRITEKAIEEAEAIEADYILLDLNTFGGLVTDADAIRSALLDTKIPTMVFVRNNAASAGALISIACDSIYMKTGSTIGAAAVVYEDGSYAEEKYQSYMRNKMRATAEATNRDPDIAEGMVNPKIIIEGVTDETEIITFSVDEAIANGYCNGKAETIEEVLSLAGLEDAEIIKHEVSPTEKLISFLVNPMVSGILLLILVAGIFFELQTPGVGFPLAASIFAAILYFAPLYLEGFAANWEILVFIAGVVLLLAEIFIIPGFGLVGIMGIAAIMMSLSLALIKNIDGFDFGFVPAQALGSAFLMVSGIMVVGVIMLLFASKNIANTKAFKRLALSTEQNRSEGFVISAQTEVSMDGKEAVVIADLRPAGKIEIDDEQYDAQSDGEYLAKGTRVLVIKRQGAYLMVKEIKA